MLSRDAYRPDTARAERQAYRDGRNLERPGFAVVDHAVRLARAEMAAHRWEQARAPRTRERPGAKMADHFTDPHWRYSDESEQP